MHQLRVLPVITKQKTNINSSTIMLQKLAKYSMIGKVLKKKKNVQIIHIPVNVTMRFDFIRHWEKYYLLHRKTNVANA